MIRVNLLPSKGTKRRKRISVSMSAGSNTLMVGFMALLVLLLGGLYTYAGTLEETAQQAGMGIPKLNEEKDRIEKLVSAIKKVKKARIEYEKQRRVFDSMADAKVGPINTLLYFSYVLRRVDASLPDDEYEALNKGWSSENDGQMSAGEQVWNPDSIWIVKFEDKDGEVVVEGEAKNHEDVMTFLRRLKTGVYFEGLDLVYQKVEEDTSLGLPYVKFKLSGLLNYNPSGYQPLIVKKQ